MTTTERKRLADVWDRWKIALTYCVVVCTGVLVRAGWDLWQRIGH